jgi:DNA-binding IscR family transcriptional regulator
MTSKKILCRIATLYPDEPFRIRDIGTILRLKPNYISAIFSNLRRWGCIRYQNREKRGWGGYLITPWGLTCAARWEKEEQ